MDNWTKSLLLGRRKGLEQEMTMGVALSRYQSLFRNIYSLSLAEDIQYKHLIQA